MTTAKLVPAPAEGHGLTDRITQPHFSAYTKGEPIQLVPALVLLKVHGQTSRDTAQGRHQSVQYEVVKIEPVIEPGDRDNLLWQIQSLYEARTSTGDQRPLPIGLPNEERRQFLMERIEEWSTQQELTGAQLEQRWRDHFGVTGDKKDTNLFGIPGDYRKGLLNQLLEFAIEVGAEPRPEAAEKTPEDDDGDGDD